MWATLKNSTGKLINVKLKLVNNHLLRSSKAQRTMKYNHSGIQSNYLS